MRQFKVGTILVVGFGVYGSLASIFPNAFSNSADKAALIGWLWNQSLVWLSIPIAVAWFGWVAYTIMERLDALKEDYGNLWNRINANNDNLQRSINETAKQVRAPIEQRLDALETRKLEEVDRRLGRLDERLEALVGFVRPLSRIEMAIHALKVKTGLIQIPTGNDVNSQEIIFTDADTRRNWRFGEVHGLSEGERVRLEQTRPDVWKAYEERLYRDIPEWNRPDADDEG